eukprot:gene3975-14054_t
MGGKQKTKKQKTDGSSAQAKHGGDAVTSSAGGGVSDGCKTLSIALPGSIIEDVETVELATAICGQVARTAAAYCVDEIILYDDGGQTDAEENAANPTISAATAFMARVLQYLETPPYLRQGLIPAHDDLAAASTLPPMGLPHHLGQTEWEQYREGIVLRTEAGKGSFVDVGLDRMAFVKKEIPLKGSRVTLDLGAESTAIFMPEFSETMLQAELCSPDLPTIQTGVYRGYKVRVARSLHRVMKDCPFKSGYLSVGTSVNGVAQDFTQLVLPKFQHALVDYFNMYFNVCPYQGPKVLRTEDVLPMALASLTPALLKYGGN